MNNDNLQKPKEIKPKKSGAVIVLSILLVVSISLGISATFFSANDASTGTATIGEAINVSVAPNTSSVELFTIANSALSGATYNQYISATSTANISDSLLRIKMTVSKDKEDEKYIDGKTSENWIKGSDGYYYYDGVFSAGEKIDFLETITIPEYIENKDSSILYAVIILAESIIYEDNAAESKWTSAPEEWQTKYNTI